MEKIKCKVCENIILIIEKPIKKGFCNICYTELLRFEKQLNKKKQK